MLLDEVASGPYQSIFAQQDKLHACINFSTMMLLKSICIPQLKTTGKFENTNSGLVMMLTKTLGPCSCHTVTASLTVLLMLLLTRSSNITLSTLCAFSLSLLLLYFILPVTFVIAEVKATAKKKSVIFARLAA